MVNGRECKVFGASNVEFVTRTRTEHLSEGDKAKARGPRTPLHSFLGIADNEDRAVSTEVRSLVTNHFIFYFVFSFYFNFFFHICICCIFLLMHVRLSLEFKGMFNKL